MTRVLYEPKKWRLEISGHAGAGSKGYDLVCAAVSVLGWTLIAATEDFGQTARVGDGYLEVRCAPTEKQAVRCGAAFDTIVAGLTMLAEREPGYLEFQVGW